MRRDEVEPHPLTAEQYALCDAIAARDVDAVRSLLGRGLNPDFERGGGETALAYAAGVSTPEVVRALLEAGATGAPMTAAACGGHAETLRMLLDRGGDPDEWDERGWTPLMEAAFWGHADAVGLLLAHGADPSVETYGGQTALGNAERHGTPEVVALLRAAGAHTDEGYR